MAQPVVACPSWPHRRSRQRNCRLAAEDKRLVTWRPPLPKSTLSRRPAQGRLPRNCTSGARRCGADVDGRRPMIEAAECGRAAGRREEWSAGGRDNDERDALDRSSCRRRRARGTIARRLQAADRTADRHAGMSVIQQSAQEMGNARIPSPSWGGAGVGVAQTSEICGYCEFNDRPGDKDAGLTIQVHP